MNKVRRTTSFDSAYHNVIVAAGESTQTDCAAFIEQQKQLLIECKRLEISVPTEGGVTRKSNDEGTNGGIKMNFSDDHYRSTFSSGDRKDPPPVCEFVHISKEDYKMIEEHELGRSDTILGVLGGRKISESIFLGSRFKHSFVILSSPSLREPGKLKSSGCLA